MGRESAALYLEATDSLCPECLRSLPGRIVERDGRVWVERTCPEHGPARGLLEANAAWQRRKRDYDKPGTLVAAQTAVSKGCPFDCGLCPDHAQHACIGLIEVTNACDLHCPLCFADAAGPGRGRHLDLATIGGMLDFFVESEGGKAEILQISGGEPSLHPEILEIIRMARARPIGYVMLNTNGMRLAEDPDFAVALGEFRGGFEVYLQFDGLDDRINRELRGRDLVEIKRRAVANCQRAGVPVTLVATVRAGLNDKHLAALVDFGLRTDGVRGLNLQPEAWFGRGYRPTEQRMTLSGVLEALVKACNGLLTMDDFIPLPCNVDRVALTYLHRQGEGFVPIIRGVRVKEALSLVNNTFLFRMEDVLKNSAREILNPVACCGAMAFVKDFLHVVPTGFFLKSKAEKYDYIDRNTFRISVSSFVDAHNADRKSLQKECVHVITPDRRKVPFSAWNMIHRDKAT